MATTVQRDPQGIMVRQDSHVRSPRVAPRVNSAPANHAPTLIENGAWWRRASNFSPTVISPFSEHQGVRLCTELRKS